MTRTSWVVLFVLALASRAHAFASEPFEIAVVSSRPDMITGPEALVRITVPASASFEKVVVHLDATDVTALLQRDADAHALVGVLSGFNPGVHTITASRDGVFVSRDTRLVTHAYPPVGPIFSGPHEQPFVCETAAFTMPDGSSLGPALDADCQVAPRVDYYYRAAAGAAWVPLASKDRLPADVMRVRTSIGATVPYVVRVETGTVNRAIYQIAVLHDPTLGHVPDVFHRSPGWNGRLVYTFGGGCTTGWYRQGATTGGVMDDPILRQGYAMASASLNVFGNNCNEVSAAETMMMVKERFIEAYGPPKHTIGWGCSGGSYQQHQIADNYPGLLDGIIPGCSFPEVGFATIHAISDARLLANYFGNVAPGAFTAEQQRAVTGFLTLATMPNVAVSAGRISPTEHCPAVLPEGQRYAATNPSGARCDVYDHMVNVYGRDANGFARRPLDNVGIQYGLQALNRGVISAEQFLALNEGIGGYDVDAHIVPARTVADPVALDAAYRTGRLTNGGLGLRGVPIIDYRAYADDLPEGDIHLRYHSFAMRERLLAANGTSANQVMLVEDFRYGLYSAASPMLLGALAAMDTWLGNIAKDRGRDDALRKVIRNKPESLREGCATRDPTPVFIAEQLVRGSGQCEALYPSPGAPREVAGASVRGDIVKCTLKSIDINDYEVPFDDDARARLAKAFPSGVCDWSARGVKQRAPAGVWQRF